MTYEEYRQHMTDYSRRAAVMSFVQFNNPDYKALMAAGEEIVPWMVQDLASQKDEKSSAMTYDKINCHAITCLLHYKVSDPIVVPEDKRGRVRYINDAWIQWGVDHGFVVANTPVPPEPRKWEFFIKDWSLSWGDRTTRKAHTQIGFAIVMLLGWGLYWVVKHL